MLKHGCLLLLLIPAALVGGAASAGPPSWALHDTQRLDGNLYRAVCSGAGPSIGFARQEAIDSCKVSAAQHLPMEITVRSMSVTSERNGAFQQEVLNRAKVSGLICNPKREEIEESDAEVRLWILCEFDLSRAHASSEPVAGPLDPDWVAAAGEPARYQTDRRRVLTLAVVPRCSDLIVRGDSPARVIPCDQDPISILIEPTDKEVLVRASGYLPKPIPVESTKEARTYAKVILEPNP